MARSAAYFGCGTEFNLGVCLLVTDGSNVLIMGLAAIEVGNAIWRRTMRGELTPEIAISIYGDFTILRPFRIAGQEDLYVKAFEVSTMFNITIYDPIFMQLSKDFKLQLVTSDDKVVEVS